MDLPTSVSFFYPRLIPIHQLVSEEDDDMPPAIRCTIDKMADDGAYILGKNHQKLCLFFALLSYTFLQTTEFICSYGWESDYHQNLHNQFLVLNVHNKLILTDVVYLCLTILYQNVCVDLFRIFKMKDIVV
jgi:hypothetical protein